MADKKQTCGGKTITYPSECTYSCVCPGGNNPCTWTVTCGNGPPISGTGLTAQGGNGRPRPKVPQVTLDGNLSVLAKMLEETWKRRVTVPANLRTRKIRKRTLKGTPEEIASTLGLRLGAKITRRRTGPRVVIK